MIPILEHAFFSTRHIFQYIEKALSRENVFSQLADRPDTRQAVHPHIVISPDIRIAIVSVSSQNRITSRIGIKLHELPRIPKFISSLQFLGVAVVV